MEYTVFNVRIPGKELVFRHTAANVSEFISIRDDLIIDAFGVQAVRKADIISVELNPVPYRFAYFNIHNEWPGNEQKLWKWVYSLPEDERKAVAERYQD